ncbi:unnamed protein product, partial [marine sediment metagenome]
QSYPETTGYIIPTFYDYHHFTNQEEYRNRALKMADWLVSIQLPDGAFQGGPVDTLPKPSVFNTGQIILGLMRAYRETRNENYLESAEKAGDWLIEMQDKDGAWRKCAYNGIPHAYYTRVAWSLLELYHQTNKISYKISAIRNLDWALGNQNNNGWFKENGFDLKINPFTHNVVYTARGLLESGMILAESKYIDSAEKVAEILFMQFEANKFLYGDFDENWKCQSHYSCLTGNAQLSILLMKLYRIKRDARYLNTAIKLNEYVRSTQILDSNNDGIKGGIKGSDPIWGDYITYRYPNWAV